MVRTCNEETMNNVGKVITVMEVRDGEGTEGQSTGRSTSLMTTGERRTVRRGGARPGCLKAIGNGRSTPQTN